MHSTAHNSAAPATGIIPQLHQPLTDPKERFTLYDVLTSREVERSANLAAAIRGFADAFDARPPLQGRSGTTVPGLIHAFGGHPAAITMSLSCPASSASNASAKPRIAAARLADRSTSRDVRASYRVKRSLGSVRG